MNNMPWLRLYTDTVDNEKLRLISAEDRWYYIAILCLKQQQIIDDKSKLRDRKIAIKLGIELDDLSALKKRLIEVDLINEQWQPKGWAKRQFVSDDAERYAKRNAERQRKFRKRKKDEEKQYDINSNVTRNVISDVTITPLDTDTHSDADKKTIQKVNSPDTYKKSTVFHKPSVDEIKTYCQSRGNGLNAQQIFDHYEANGWMRGRTKIKDWKACVRTWEVNNPKNQNLKDDPYAGNYH